MIQLSLRSLGVLFIFLVNFLQFLQGTLIQWFRISLSLIWFVGLLLLQVIKLLLYSFQTICLFLLLCPSFSLLLGKFQENLFLMLVYTLKFLLLNFLILFYVIFLVHHFNLIIFSKSLSRLIIGYFQTFIQFILMSGNHNYLFDLFFLL